ncbi:MAG: L-rhamnose mutarotase [Saprospiraceae bacterium]|nr:L-rhamnose mutarotase [Saprospiraceae bacterium]
MKNLIITCLLSLFFLACNTDENKINQKWHKDIMRVGMVVKVKKDSVEEYKKVHADNNPGVRHLLTKYNLRNFSIFMIQLADGEWYEFGYYEYWGSDFEGDMVKLNAEPENAKWLELCDPMQEGILPGQKGWKTMDRVYYNY